MLIGGLGYLAVRLLQAQPVELQVDYHLEEARHGLVAATLVYRKDGHELRRVRFNYGRHRPAPRVQSHRIKVPRGDLELAIELRYRRASDTVRLRRPLVVSGEGRVSVHVSD